MERPPQIVLDADEPLTGDEVVGARKDEQAPLSPEAQAFYMEEYARVRDLITAYAEGHEDEYYALFEATSRFVKENLENNGTVRQYVLYHPCVGSSPDPATLRYLDTEEGDFQRLIATHTNIDLYGDDEDDQ